MYIKEYEMCSTADYCGQQQELTVKFILDKNSRFDPSIIKGRVAIIPSEGVVRETKEQVAAKIAGTNVTASNIGYAAPPKPVSKDDILNDKKFAEMVQAACDKEIARKAASSAETKFKLEYEKCARNQAKTIRSSGPAIRTLDGLPDGVHPPFLYPYQREIMKGLMTHDESTSLFLSSPRQSGKSFATEYLATYDFNPCREIMMNDNNTPHSLRVQDGRESRMNVNGSNGLMATLTFSDETIMAKINLPGIAPERVEMRQIDNRLRIRVAPLESELRDDYGFEREAPRKELTLVLTDEEEVIDSKLALGVLEISIDRGREVQDFAIDVVSE